ncbi:collagen-like protein [Aliifodinibius salipaludis]|nr:collagen-like protein [Aliifodinibius salipaludis]
MHRITRIVTLLLVCSISIFMACEGPSGSEGPQGPEGPEGPVGPAGEDGSMMYSGQDAPDATTGENGDYYLDETTGELYGPKNDDGWGTPISLQGPPGQDGQDGEDGSQIHSGSGAPDASLGSVGDYYLDEDSYDLYGPKTENGWDTPINLKGTANVMYSSWITVPGEASEWSAEEVSGDSIRYHDIAANALTEDIVGQGVVNVYADFRDVEPDIDQIYALPMSNLPGFAVSLYYQFSLQNVMIAYYDPSAKGTDLGPLTVDTKFRYVIIPGGVAAKSKMTKDEIKEMPYNEVKKRFGIQE